MASVQSLPPDQRAVLELVLRRGRTYDEIAQLLSIDRADVRHRALSALDALGPDAGVPAERRALITDYLLGALPPRVTEQVRDSLGTSPAQRAWARVIAAELEPIATRPLPEIPAGGPAEAPKREPDAGAPAMAPEPVQERGAARPQPEAGRQRTADEHAEGAEERGRRPPAEPGAQRPASRRGGRVVLTGAVIVVLGVVLALVFTSSSGKKPRTIAAHVGTTPTTSTTGTTGTTSTTASKAQILGQVNLYPPSGGKAKGIAEVVRQAGNAVVAIVASGLTPNGAHNAYAVWLSNSPGDSQLLGFVNPGVGSNGRLETRGPLPSNVSHFHKLLVTLETKQTPHSPGTIVLAGVLHV
jgi:hypothetical protein